MRRVVHLPWIAALLATLLTAACGPGGGASQRPVELRIAAASSLRGAVANLAAAYTAAHPGVTIVVATDSSAALRTQIEQGAPVDVFLSADAGNPQGLADAGLVAGSPTPFAANTLALVVPSTDPAGIETPADLARAGVRVVAAGPAVPITAYADQVLGRLAATAGYPTGFLAAVEANVVSREDNVAAVLAKVELGEADAGFVYATDAAASARTRTIPIPDDANVRAADVGVVVKASAHPDLAADLLAWIAGAGGQAVLRPLGFLAP